MCQNHSAAEEDQCAAPQPQPCAAAAAGRGSESASNGAATSTRIMCCATRAENSATESAHSGESSARAVTAQPHSAVPRREGPTRLRRAPRPEAISASIRTGSRLKRQASSAGEGAAPQ